MLGIMVSIADLRLKYIFLKRIAQGSSGHQQNKQTDGASDWTDQLVLKRLQPEINFRGKRFPLTLTNFQGGAGIHARQGIFVALFLKFNKAFDQVQ